MNPAIRPCLALLAACTLAWPARAQDSSKKAQQIVFPELPSRSVADAPFQLTAHATSKLAVSYAVIDGPAVLDGKSTVRLTGQPGLVVIRASQAGNAIFGPAAQTERVFAVTSKAAAVTFRMQPMDAHASIGGLIVLRAEATGEPKPAYQWHHNGIEIAGATESRLTIGAATQADAGSYYVTASNALGSATSAPVHVVVGRRGQYIVFSQIPPVAAGQTVTLVATATSGLPVKFDLVAGSATLNGQALTVMSGIVAVQASQPGNDTFDAASPVTQNLVVGPSVSGRILP